MFGILKLRSLALLLLLTAVLLTSCSEASGAASVTLDFAPAPRLASSGNVDGIDAEGSYVLRCASLAEEEGGLTFAASKSKGLTPETLLFVRLPEDAGPGDGIVVVAAHITGKEYEYDMAQAKSFIVTGASAMSAVRDFGIPFLDWQTGAVMDSEKFPCCQ